MHRRVPKYVMYRRVATQRKVWLRKVVYIGIYKGEGELECGLHSALPRRLDRIGLAVFLPSYLG